jgi:excisionase family DNA binding protein
MTSKEVCALLRITRPTLFAWNKAGKITGKKLGNKWIFKASDIKRLLP